MGISELKISLWISSCVYIYHKSEKAKWKQQLASLPLTKHDFSSTALPFFPVSNTIQLEMHVLQ